MQAFHAHIKPHAEKLSCRHYVLSMSCLVHTADTDKTRQSCLVLTVSAVWT